jgi:hypothetical protein
MQRMKGRKANQKCHSAEQQLAPRLPGESRKQEEPSHEYGECVKMQGDGPDDHREREGRFARSRSRRKMHAQKIIRQVTQNTYMRPFYEISIIAGMNVLVATKARLKIGPRNRRPMK